MENLVSHSTVEIHLVRLLKRCEILLSSMSSQTDAANAAAATASIPSTTVATTAPAPATSTNASSKSSGQSNPAGSGSSRSSSPRNPSTATPTTTTGSSLSVGAGTYNAPGRSHLARLEAYLQKLESLFDEFCGQFGVSSAAAFAKSKLASASLSSSSFSSGVQSSPASKSHLVSASSTGSGGQMHTLHALNSAAALSTVSTSAVTALSAAHPDALPAGKMSFLENSIIVDYARRIASLRKALEAEGLDVARDGDLPNMPLTFQSTGSESVLLMKGPSASALTEVSTASAPELLGFRRRRNLELVSANPGALPDGTATDPPVDSLLEYHKQLQDKLTDEMLLLAQSMKQQANTALDVLQQDNRNLDSVGQVATENLGRMTSLRARVQFQYNKNSRFWTILFMILGVSIVFLWMVIFIVVFPRPRSRTP